MNAWIDSRPGPLMAKFIEENGETVKDRFSTDDVAFAVWMHTLNRWVQRRVGLSYDDLEDWNYRDAYDADLTPYEAAVDMLVDNGWGGALQ